MEENHHDVNQDLQPKADSKADMAGTFKQQILNATAALAVIAIEFVI